MSKEIRIVDWDTGDIRDTVNALAKTEYTHELGKESGAVLKANRSDIEPLSLDIGDDKVYLNTDRFGDEFGGRLANIRWRGEVANLEVRSFEKDAIDAKPAGDGTGKWHYENVADSTIIKDAIDRVSGLSKGTIQTVETGLSYRFSRVSQAKIMRTVEKAGDGELFYNPDASVDYVDTLGRDRTNVTITENDSRIQGEFDVEKAGDERKINKLVMLGSGEGPGQIAKTVTADTFDSSTEREKWGTRVNRELNDSATVETVGDFLVDELNSDFIEAETALGSIDVNLGDKYHVEYSPKNINRDLRITKATTILKDGGRSQEVVFSNRTKSREKPADELIKNVRKAGRVLDGFTVPLPISAGPGPVSANLKFRFSIPYPSDILIENKVDLQIRGLPEYDDDNDTTTSDFPENLDVLINGSSLGLSIGDGTSAFTKTVDLTGELAQGSINTVDFTSDRKARAYAALDADLYRQMVTD